jgi:hypothetical protein
MARNTILHPWSLTVIENEDEFEQVLKAMAPPALRLPWPGLSNGLEKGLLCALLHFNSNHKFNLASSI